MTTMRNPPVSLGAKFQSSSTPRLKFKSPRLHKKVTLLENVPRPQSSAEVKISVVRSALNTLLKIAQDDPTSSQDILQIHKVLSKAIVYPRAKLHTALLSEVIDRYTDIASEQDDIPYFCICEILLGFLSKKQNEVIALETKLNEVVSQYKNEIEQRQADTTKLKEALDKIHEKQKPELQKLEETRDELIQTRVNFEKTVAKLIQKETELKEARRALNKENETFLNMTRKLKEYKQQINKLTSDNVRLQTDGTQLSLNCQHIGDNFNTALLRLKQTQAANSTLTEELRQRDELLNDLNVRAAVAFGDFTPRPSLCEIGQELGIEYAYKESTVEKCEKILQAVRKVRKRNQRNTIFSRKLVETASTESLIPEP